MAEHAAYALLDADSRGRRYPEAAHSFRTPFQRDRERIVHSSAFRRMTGKTQVLVASVNDHHRTRLTHTLEVTQVARTAARRLRLNEDLTEAIALAHDIGHPPFGHAGEAILNDCLRSVGGFNHNLYGLRRVDELEERYPEFPGLNLTFELREAFVSHSGKMDAPEATEFRGRGQPPLEAQVVDTVDSITYDVHDLDDALGLGFLEFDDLKDVELWKLTCERVRKQYANLPGKAFRTAVIRELLAWLVTDLLDATAGQIESRNIRTATEVRECPVPLVGFTAEMRRMKTELERFLRANVYQHHKVLRMTASGKRILKALFDEYVRAPELLPARHSSRWVGAEPTPAVLPNRRLENHIERVVGDYLAGMTDRYAQQEHRRLFSPMGD
jgi:dGTPase